MLLVSGEVRLGPQSWAFAFLDWQGALGLVEVEKRIEVWCVISASNRSQLPRTRGGVLELGTEADGERQG